MDKTIDFKPFVFESDVHLRYESGLPVMGVQKCKRTIIVEQNIKGCEGYRLEPNKGYIVKIYNNDEDKPVMADKPMKIGMQGSNVVKYEGYEVEAMTPFGWQQFDLSDYGLTVYYDENGNVCSCILNMYDRETAIEYRSLSSTDLSSFGVIPEIPEDKELDRCTGHPARPNEIPIARENQRIYFGAYYRCPDYQYKIKHHDPLIGKNPFVSMAQQCKQDCLFPTCPFYSSWGVNARFNPFELHLHEYDLWVVQAYIDTFGK
jgi:hypothetical protein